MRRRFFVESVADGAAALRDGQAQHLARVLRVRPGQIYELACDGVAYLGTVTGVSSTEVRFEVGERLAAASPVPALELASALFKFDRFDWMLEKATELGVTRIVPLITRRTDVKLAAAARKRLERWRRVALEASEQSRRDTLPELAEPVTLARFLAQFRPHTGLLLSESGGEKLGGNVGDATLLIGPEGGWTEDETAAAIGAGYRAIWLGPHILRCETAALAALARLSG